MGNIEERLNAIEGILHRTLQREDERLEREQTPVGAEPIFTEEMVNMAKAPDDPREIDRQFFELQQQAQRLERVVTEVINRTHVVAAMERSIPSPGDAESTRDPETEMGKSIYMLVSFIKDNINRLEDHLYKLEL